MHKDGLSKVNINGEIKNLKDVITNKDLGKNSEQFSNFPVLIKLIDAKEDAGLYVEFKEDTNKNQVE